MMTTCQYDKCGRRYTPHKHGQKYCSLRCREARRNTRSTAERGLGHEHRKHRDTLLRVHIEGTPCWWCGLPMYKRQALAADHTHTRANGGTHADRLLHSLCNTERGDGSRDHLRPALTRHGSSKPTPSRHW